MRFRMNYIAYICQDPAEGCGECGVSSEVIEGKGRDFCRKCEPEGEKPCKLMTPMKKTIAKESKSIEILKDPQHGYATIDGETFRLQNVELLQVDYGNGMVTEWEKEEDWGESDELPEWMGMEE